MQGVSVMGNEKKQGQGQAIVEFWQEKFNALYKIIDDFVGNGIDIYALSPLNHDIFSVAMAYIDPDTEGTTFKYLPGVFDTISSRRSKLKTISGVNTGRKWDNSSTCFEAWKELLSKISQSDISQIGFNDCQSIENEEQFYTALKDKSFDTNLLESYYNILAEIQFPQDSAAAPPEKTLGALSKFKKYTTHPRDINADLYKAYLLESILFPYDYFATYYVPLFQPQAMLFFFARIDEPTSYHSAQQKDKDFSQRISNLDNILSALINGSKYDTMNVLHKHCEKNYLTKLDLAHLAFAAWEKELASELSILRWICFYEDIKFTIDALDTEAFEKETQKAFLDSLKYLIKTANPPKVLDGTEEITENELQAILELRTDSKTTKVLLEFDNWSKTNFDSGLFKKYKNQFETFYEFVNQYQNKTAEITKAKILKERVSDAKEYMKKTKLEYENNMGILEKSLKEINVIFGETREALDPDEFIPGTSRIAELAEWLRINIFPKECDNRYKGLYDAFEVTPHNITQIFKPAPFSKFINSNGLIDEISGKFKETVNQIKGTYFHNELKIWTDKFCKNIRPYHLVSLKALTNFYNSAKNDKNIVFSPLLLEMFCGATIISKQTGEYADNYRYKMDFKNSYPNKHLHVCKHVKEILSDFTHSGNDTVELQVYLCDNNIKIKWSFENGLSGDKEKIFTDNYAKSTEGAASYMHNIGSFFIATAILENCEKCISNGYVLSFKKNGNIT